jgi:hypothetical protein
MKGREVLLVVLVVAIALGSGLIGLVLGRSSVGTESAPTGQTVTGAEVASGTTRLWTTANKTGDVAYEIDSLGGGEARIYQGTVSNGQTILFFDGDTFYAGANANGEPLYTVDGNQIYVGASTNGPLFAFVADDGRVHEGDSTGDIIARIDGERFREGATLSGDIVYAGNKNLNQGVVRFVLPILHGGEGF